MLDSEHDTREFPTRSGFLEQPEIPPFVGGKEERKAVISLGLVVLGRGQADLELRIGHSQVLKRIL